MKKYIKSSTPYEQPLDPPDPIEPYETSVEVPIDIFIDDTLVVDDEGYFEFISTDPDWTYGDGRNGEWTDGTYDIPVADPNRIEECIADLIEDKIPDKSGTYKVQGMIKLVFNISDIHEYNNFYGLDEDGYPIEDTRIDTDYVDIDYIEDASYAHVAIVPVKN